jgi:hypothetical protein
VKQADSAHSTTTSAPAARPVSLSRRLLLGRLGSTAAAGAVLGAPLAMASAADGDDTELLALKPRFDELFERWAKMHIRERVECRERHAALSRETGLGERPEIDWDDPDWRRWNEASTRYGDQEKMTAAEVETDTWKSNEFLDALDETGDEILRYYPTTLEGVRLQVRAIMMIEAEIVWSNECSDNEEPNNPRVAGFFESLCEFLELPFPPYVVPPAA